MNLALTVLEIVAPAFLLGAIGFVWVKLGFEYRIQFATQLSMNLAVPRLISVPLRRPCSSGRHPGRVHLPLYRPET